MRRRKPIRLLAALCLLTLLSGCGNKGVEEAAPVQTLAPATVRWEAPDGDRVVGKPGDYLLYVPVKDQAKLGVRSVHLESANLTDTAEELIRRLLAEVNGNGALRIERELDLYRDAPLEISRGVCTVNLSSAALQLSYSDYYKLSAALATTLCELEEIRSVNVLTAGQSVAMDSPGRLPMGSMTGHADEDLSVLWEQMEARRTPQGGDPGKTPLSTQATVYYPLADGRGVACESRRITFEGQTTGKLSSMLLNAMSEIVRGKTESDNVPDLWEYMVHEPVSSEMEEGGKLITLSFREDLQELADGWNTDIPCLAAAVTLTLTTFVPGTAAVCIRIGDKPLTELDSGRFRVGTILGGLMRRNLFESFLTGSITVFFEKDGRLIRMEKPVDGEEADSPRAQLNALIQGPDDRDTENGVTSALAGSIREDDILGIAPEEDTMLVNFSSRCKEVIAALGPEKEMLLCYALVNTLCENNGMKRVCFFFEGKQTEWIAGEIYWAGEFLYNPEV